MAQTMRLLIAMTDRALSLKGEGIRFIFIFPCDPLWEVTGATYFHSTPAMRFFCSHFFSSVCNWHIIPVGRCVVGILPFSSTSSSERHIYLQFNATEKNKPIPTISGLERKVRSFILSR